MRHRASLTAALVASLLATGASAEQLPVTFSAPHFDEELTFFGVGPDCRLLPRELDLLQQLLRCRRTEEHHPIDQSLGRQLVKIARRFGRPVQILSGYRATPLHGHRRSYHLRGKAADIYIPGVPAVAIRDFAVEQGVRGIGFYPKSGFVHLDVRDRRFWWVDYSTPGHLEELIPDPDGSAPVERPAKAEGLSKTDRRGG